MLDRLQPQPADALLALIKLHEADQRPDKIDLGVGVYRTGSGATPVFAAIKRAEARLVDEQETKAYLGPEGDLGFVNALMPYIFGRDASMGGRIDGLQTPGGTGAVRLAAALAQKAGVSRVILGRPSWPNHAQILNDLGLEMVPFDHVADDGTANLAALLSAIRSAQAGDAVLLHGCCHNPTGVDYSEEQWQEIATALADNGVLPILDVAYQGLGHGLEEDAAGFRRVLATVPQALLAYSCDKNFGLYRDRVGALYIIAQESDQLPAIVSNANALARANWSMPPDHGGAAVRIVLRDAELTENWLEELDSMRARMRFVRKALAEAGRAGAVDLAPLGKQNGLFSTLPVSSEQVERLREEHGVYMAGSGRVNIAGLHEGNIEKFVAALADVTS